MGEHMDVLNDKVFELLNCSKHFGGVKALQNINYSIHRNKINGLVGENGAGKTTLLSILTGMVQRDSGKLIIENKEYVHYSNVVAKNLGILMVTQQVQLFPQLTIAENMFFNSTNSKTKLISFNLMKKNTLNIFKEVGFNYNPGEKLGNLNYVDQQMIQICKVIYSSNPKIIVLDEPTAALPDKDIKLLFSFIRQLKNHGVTFVYVSHLLEEIFEICDLVTVLRDGVQVYEGEVANLNMELLVNQMIGKGVDLYPPKKTYVRDEIILEAIDLEKKPLLKKINFKLRKGEILGISGLRGSGSNDIGKIIGGIVSPDKGRINISGNIMKYGNTKKSRKLGVGYLPNDRNRFGIIPNRSVGENISIGFFKKIVRFFFIIFFKKELFEINKYIKLLNIKTPSVKTEVKKLSGGNQQKVVLSRLIGGDYPILIMEDPSFGVDVNVKSEIHKIMYQMVESGSSIILITEELNELIKMSDRILVLKNGYIVNEFNYGDVSYNKLKGILLEE
jgi:ribose transport system ATP-binding protein